MEKELKGSFVQESKEPVIERIFKLVQRYPSRSAAARAWEINVNTLKNYYRRKDINPTPRPAQLSKIAEVEGVSMDWLLNGCGEPEKNPKSQDVNVPDRTDERLLDLFSVLSKQEKQALTDMLMRKGIETALYLLDEDNIELLRLDRVVKEKILGKQSATIDEADQNAIRARECGSDTESQTATPSLTEKKQAV